MNLSRECLGKNAARDMPTAEIAALISVAAKRHVKSALKVPARREAV